MKKVIFFFAILSSGFFYGQITSDTIFRPIDMEFVESIKTQPTKKKSLYLKIGYEEFENRMFDYVYLHNQNSTFDIHYNALLYPYVNKYLSYKWFEKIIGLSWYYFPLFEAKLQQYNLPSELKYLAIVESNLNPRATSHMGAKGLWQFMPATGTHYNLMHNNIVSLYYDPVASTDAACRFLSDLYKEFEDWGLAISAYNCGAGNVRKAIRKAKSTDYWKVRMYLPEETKSYYPSIIAVLYMFEFYQQHEIYPSYFKYNFFDNDIIVKDKNFDAKLRQNDFFKFANPHLLKQEIPSGVHIYVKKEL